MKSDISITHNYKFLVPTNTAFYHLLLIYENLWKQLYKKRMPKSFERVGNDFNNFLL